MRDKTGDSDSDNPQGMSAQKRDATNAAALKKQIDSIRSMNPHNNPDLAALLAQLGEDGGDVATVQYQINADAARHEDVVANAKKVNLAVGAAMASLGEWDSFTTFSNLGKGQQQIIELTANGDFDYSNMHVVSTDQDLQSAFGNIEMARDNRLRTLVQQNLGVEMPSMGMDNPDALMQSLRQMDEYSAGKLYSPEDASTLSTIRDNHAKFAAAETDAMALKQGDLGAKANLACDLESVHSILVKGSDGMRGVSTDTLVKDAVLAVAAVALPAIVNKNKTAQKNDVQNKHPLAKNSPSSLLG